MAFKDHFSTQSAGYTQFRPTYPAALFEYLASVCPARELAWDCGTGNGQSAVVLAEHFAEVLATDASANQIAHAELHPRVKYFVAPAEQTPIENGSVDLVTVSQALHWFDFERFFVEVRRVARPGGIVAAWSYGLAEITPEIDAVVAHLYGPVLGPYWPAERSYVEQRYETVPFPFDELPPPRFAMTATWRLDELLGYLRTWSSAEKYRVAHGRDAVAEHAATLQKAWGDADTARAVVWPLFLRVGRTSPLPATSRINFS